MDNQLADNTAGSTPTLLTRSADEYNALQCQVIAIRRSNDALILENNKLRLELNEAIDNFYASENRSRVTILELNEKIDAIQVQHEESLQMKRKEYADKFEKIREYSANLLSMTRHKYQTRLSILNTSWQMQQKADELAREDLEKLWQQRMDDYRNELTGKFNSLLESVASIQDEKKQKESLYLDEIQCHKNVCENLKLENRTLTDKLNTIELTLEQFKENNSLIREKLCEKETLLNGLQNTVRKGIEERAELEAIITDLKKKAKAIKNTEKVVRKNESVKEDKYRSPSVETATAEGDAGNKTSLSKDRDKPKHASLGTESGSGKTVSESKVMKNLWKKSAQNAPKVWK